MNTLVVENRLGYNRLAWFVIRSTNYVQMDGELVRYTQVVEVYRDGFVSVTSFMGDNMPIRTDVA